MWCFGVYLGKTTAVTRAAVPGSTSVCDVSVFTWVRLQQQQGQRYPVRPVLVVFYCLPGGWWRLRWGWGGFSLAGEDSRGRLDDSFPARAFYSFRWRSVRAHQFHFLGHDQSTVAHRAETTVVECFLTIHSLPVLFILLGGDQFAHTNSTF